MPSERRVIVFRPDEKEQDMLDFLLEIKGPPTSRMVAVAVREMAIKEGYTPDWRGKTTPTEWIEVDEDARAKIKAGIAYARRVFGGPSVPPVVKDLLKQARVIATNDLDAPFDIRIPMLGGIYKVPARLTHVPKSIIDLGVERIGILTGRWVQDCVSSERDYPIITTLEEISDEEKIRWVNGLSNQGAL